MAYELYLDGAYFDTFYNRVRARRMLREYTRKGFRAILRPVVE